MTARVARGAETVLEVRELTVSYGGVEKVHPTSFSVRRGERLAIVGESGSGKSSVANAIGGFIPRDVGTVSAQTLDLAGTSLLDFPSGSIPRRRPGLSMIFQDAMSSLDPVWSVGSQLAGVLPREEFRTRRQRRAAAEQRLAQVGISDPRRVMSALPGQLSGGMRQRVMLAIALAAEADVLIADEPTSALDIALAITVMELLSDAATEENLALIFISHDIALSRRFADTVMVMRHGHVVESIASGDLPSATHPYTRGLLACVPSLSSSDLESLPTLESVGAAS